MIYNLQATGTGVLVSALLKDVAKVPDPDDPERMILKIEQLDELTFVIYTGDDGDPEQAAAVAQLPAHPHRPVGTDRLAVLARRSRPTTPSWPPDRLDPAHSSSTATSLADRWR